LSYEKTSHLFDSTIIQFTFFISAIYSIEKKEDIGHKSIHDKRR
jgi:hypothetical protein